LVAANVLRRAGQGDRVTVLDPSGELGRGVAYARSERSLLLNVRAGNMSAFPEDPGHFVRWLVKRELADEAQAPLMFASRTDYGAYLGDVLCEARTASQAEFALVRDSARGLEADRELVVVTEQGKRLPADRVVLAMGNLRPCCPSSLRAFEKHPRFIANPWRCDALSAIEPDDTVFIVGTGLTMVDAFLLLRAHNHRGKVVARSRRGFLPKAHRASKPAMIEAENLVGDHALHAVSKLLRQSGEEWRSTFDALRPHTVAIWESLSWRDRDRFVRHLRPFWDVFRHRLPESAVAAIEEASAAGHLDVGSGRITSVVDIQGGFEITFAGDSEPIRTDWVLNCTGPTMDVRAEKIPILESAVSAGLAEYDPLGLGLMADKAGRTEGTGRLWALGPLCRGCRWETTAIPEIRVQAATIAAEMFS
jgi:uncharacterized NAD(P)/FAD-binding protein YdhS